MHWSEEIAEKIIKRNPNKEEYVCAAGISPSGSVHIGNFRDVATSYFVVKALEKRNKKAKLLLSWDDFDRLRKVPSNIAKVTTNFEENFSFFSPFFRIIPLLLFYAYKNEYFREYSYFYEYLCIYG